MALTTEQILLLNNLMYLEAGPESDNPLKNASLYEGRTIGEWLYSLGEEKIAALDDNRQDGNFISGKDWKNILNSVKQDETLMGMTIATSHTDWAEGGGGGFSVLFVNESSKEAVVAFKGTASYEWKDDFIGGNVTDTPQQENALAWYRSVYKDYSLENYEVTVTGHSKGGNKSKYITIRDDTVDRCVSFDGQGFSDKFFDKYEDKIAANQRKIENHNVDYDPVNILLNDIGKSTYYKGQDIGNGGFMENHSPNTFLKYDGNGNFFLEVSPEGQGKEMQAFDEFLNSCLRSMPDGERTETLEMMFEFLNDSFSVGEASTQQATDIFMETITNPRYSDNLAYFLAYLIKYEQEHPEFAGQIRTVMEKFGMGEMTQYVDIVENVLNFEYDFKKGPIHIHMDFDTAFGILNGMVRTGGWILDAAALINRDFQYDSEWVLEQLRQWLKRETGIDVSTEQLRMLIGTIGMVNDDLGKIRTDGDGRDRKVVSSESVSREVSGGGNLFCVTKDMQKVAEALAGIQMAMGKIGEDIGMIAEDAAMNFPNLPTVKTSILRVKYQTEAEAAKVGKIGTTLAGIVELYTATETSIAATGISAG